MWIWTCMAWPGPTPCRQHNTRNARNKRIWWKIANEAHVTACTRMFADEQTKKWETTTSNRKKPFVPDNAMVHTGRGVCVCVCTRGTYVSDRRFWKHIFWLFFRFCRCRAGKWQQQRRCHTYRRMNAFGIVYLHAGESYALLQPSLFQIQFRISIFVSPYFAFPAAASCQPYDWNCNNCIFIPRRSTGYLRTYRLGPVYCTYRVEMQEISEMLRSVKRGKKRQENQCSLSHHKLANGEKEQNHRQDIDRSRTGEAHSGHIESYREGEMRDSMQSPLYAMIQMNGTQPIMPCSLIWNLGKGKMEDGIINPVDVPLKMKSLFTENVIGTFGNFFSFISRSSRNSRWPISGFVFLFEIAGAHRVLTDDYLSFAEPHIIFSLSRSVSLKL